MLRRVLEEKDIKLLPGGDGFNADETLKRDRVLTLVDRLFDSDTALAKLKRPTNTPPDCYLLVYSGPGDEREDANWQLDDEAPGECVCLADILDRWHAAKHYERGAVLYILADADRSGVWVHQAEKMSATHVFLQASCGATETRPTKPGREEQFLKAWCQLQLGLMTEAEVEPYLGLLGQAGARVFRAPVGINFPPVAWMQSLAGLGERVERQGAEEELVPLHAFLRECLGKAEQLQPLTNMPVAAERPRLLQSPAEDVGLTESKRKMRALLLARTSPSLGAAALPIWGKPEAPSALLGPEDLASIALILRRYVLHEELAVAAVQLLWRLSWHEEYRAPVVQAGALETVFKALEVHVQNPTLVCAACGLVCRVRVTPGFRHKVLAIRGIETLVMAMRSQEDKADVQRFGCVALNVVACPPDPPLSQDSGAATMQLPLAAATILEAIETCISVLEGPVGAVPEVANAAMGAAQGILLLDEHTRKTPPRDEHSGYTDVGLPPRVDSSGTMDLALPKLVRGLGKVLARHAADPAVMRQACQLLDTIAAGRYKSSLNKVSPAKSGDRDFVHSLLSGFITHRDLDDVAWQLLSTGRSVFTTSCVASSARRTSRP